MDQSRSRFSARHKGAREARDVADGGVGDVKSGAESGADPDARHGPDRGPDSWDPFKSADAGERGESQRYTRSSEQTRGRSRRGGDQAGDLGDGEKPKRSLKGRALAYLSRREYSRIELAGKLGPYVEETDNLESMLDELEREGWLSDTRFAESLMHRRAGRFGASRIVGELKRHAVDGELLEQLDTQLRDTEAARAKAVWQKKFGALPQSPAERAKQTRFLASRGFSHAAISRLLRGLDDESDFLDDAAD